MARYVGLAEDQYLRPIVGALVIVEGQDGLAATLTDDNGNLIKQPLKTDKYGGYYFNTADGLYTIRTYRSGLIVAVEYNALVGSIDFLKGPKGDPGGNGNVVGTFAQISTVAVPAGTDLIQTSGRNAVADGLQGQLVRVASNPGLGQWDTQDATGAWFRPVAPRKSCGNRVSCAGDSTATASGDPRNVTNNFSAMACWFSGRAKAGLNTALSGATTVGLIATQLPLILADPDGLPDACFIAIGRNDISSGYGGIAAGITPAITHANIAYIDAALDAVGIEPIWLAVPPIDDAPIGYPTVPNARALTQALNAWLREFCLKNKRAYLDRYTPFANPATGQYRTGYSADGVHPGFLTIAYEAQLAAAILDTKLQPWSPPLMASDPDADNLISNGLFLTSTVTANLPDGWTIEAGSSNFSTALIAAIGAPGNMFRLYNGPAGTSGTGTVKSATIACTPGQRLGWGFKAICNGPGLPAGQNGNPQSVAYTVQRTYVGATSNGTLIPISGWHAQLIDLANVWIEDIVPPGATGFYDEITFAGSFGSIDIMQYTTRVLS